MPDVLLATWRFNFSRHTIYSSTENKRGRHVQYNINRDATDSGDGEYEKVIAVHHLRSSMDHYDLFDHRAVALKDNLLFDSVTKLTWITNASKTRITYLEAKKYLSEMKLHGLNGWRLPTYEEFRKIYDPSIPGVESSFNFTKKSYYTSTRNTRGNHIQYNPISNGTDSGDSEHEAVVGVM